MGGMADAEESATGRFWQGRFKSQALPCLTQVKLFNPVLAYYKRIRIF